MGARPYLCASHKALGRGDLETTARQGADVRRSHWRARAYVSRIARLHGVHCGSPIACVTAVGEVIQKESSTWLRCIETVKAQR